MGLGTGNSPAFTGLTLSGASPNVLSVTATGSDNPVATITGGSNTVLALINSGTVAYIKLANVTEANNFIGSDGTSLKFWTENASRVTINSAGLTLTGNLIIPDGGTIGQSAGPLLTFNDTSNLLNITGCLVGMGGTADADARLIIFSNTHFARFYESDGTVNKRLYSFAGVADRLEWSARLDNGNFARRLIIFMHDGPVV
jgi:hypothetical protein